MSLLDSEEPSGGGSRWIIVLVVALVAAAAGYWVLTGGLAPEPDRTEQAAVTTPTPDPTPETPPAPAPEPDPPEPAPEPEPVRRPPPRSEPEPTGVIAGRSRMALRLRVTADVDGADVFIDRVFAGKTPFESRDIRSGSHQVTVSAPGLGSHAANIVIPDVDGDPVTVDVRLREVRLDARVPVIHKHRFGECEGTIVASVAGLRYETADDDAFTATLEQLEEFEVDYLEHNLRIKVAGGRTYNFTDHTDNADALFVFHREVTTARERLAAGGVAAGGE